MRPTPEYQRARWLGLWLFTTLTLTSVPGAARAQQPDEPHYTAAYATPERAFTQQQLDQMLAPIALYPDALLAQILMAATYPGEVAEAARWSRLHAGLEGQQAVEAVASESWDPSVKSLVAFPRILATMGDRLQWARDLGAAFLEQEPHVMDTIQALRRRAWAAGTLRTTDQVRVEERDQAIVIEPFDLQSARAPYYDPVVVYGAWPSPSYPPVRWAWDHHAGPGYGSAFVWGPAVAVSSAFFFGAFDWHRKHAIVTHHHRHRDVGHAGFRRWEHRYGRHDNRRDAGRGYVRPPRVDAHRQQFHPGGRSMAPLDERRADRRRLQDGRQRSGPPSAAELQRRFHDRPSLPQASDRPRWERPGDSPRSSTGAMERQRVAPAPGVRSEARSARGRRESAGGGHQHRSWSGRHDGGRAGRPAHPQARGAASARGDSGGSQRQGGRRGRADPR